MATEKVYEAREAEESLLSAAMSSTEAFWEASTRVTDKQFFYASTLKIWAALYELATNQHELNYHNLIEELKTRRVLDEIGRGELQGVAYITSLQKLFVPATSVPRLVESIVEAYKRRRWVEASHRIMQLVDGDLQTLEDTMVAEISAIVGDGKADIVELRDAVSEHFDIVQERYLNPGLAMGIASGIDAYDLLLGGFSEGELSVIAGRPGTGKTALMLLCALTACMDGRNVMVFSLEMSIRQLASRLYAMVAGVPVMKQRLGDLSPQDWVDFVEGTTTLSELPGRIFFAEMSAVNAMQVRGLAQRVQMTHGLDAIFIDYLTLMGDMPNVKRGENTTDFIGRTTRALKSTALDLKIPIILGAQLSRAVEKRSDKRPRLPDLRSSGDIEQDADNVTFLYRPSDYEDDYPFDDVTELLVEKSRHGDKGMVVARFNAPRVLFENAKMD